MKKLFFILLLFLGSKAFAYHIVGGEMIYDFLGNNNYRITLKIYKDCSPNVTTPFDGVTDVISPAAVITVYDSQNNFIGLYDIGAPVITTVPSAFNNPCIFAPNTICVQEGVYTYTLNLPPKAGGYTVVYQRCCRNVIISNLVNPDKQGATYFTKIPGPETAVVNSSPRFSAFPPIYICAKVKFNFNHAATDPDGDQLVYSLCAPFTGLDGCCPSIGTAIPSNLCGSPPASCPTEASPPPYSNVLFTTPFSGTYPIASSPAFSIDSVTGKLSGTPTTSDIYVVGICVKEYRNNQLINTHFRDFQFSVIPCTVTALSAVADQVKQCQGQTISFINKSVNQASNPVYHWDFGVPIISNDTSALVNPTYTYPDTGIFILSLIVNPGKQCTDTLKKPVYVFPALSVNYQRPAKQCLVSNSFQFAATGTFVSQTTFNWDFSSTATPSTSVLKNPSAISFSTSGWNQVYLRAKQFACRDSFLDSIYIIKRPIAKINGIPPVLCDPAKLNFKNGSSSELPLNYYWDFGNGKNSKSFEPEQVFSPAGKYTVSLIVETASVCADRDTSTALTITVNPTPKANFELSPLETSIFDPLINISTIPYDGGINYFYDFGDGTFTKSNVDYHVYTNYGDFVFTQYVMNSFGCRDSLSETVKILPEFRFWIPNAFSPDDNTLNDEFKPSCMGVTDYEFDIFDRWGHVIYHGTDPKSGWDGFIDGLPCPRGVYTWKIVFKNVVTRKTESRVGDVILWRVAD